MPRPIPVPVRQVMFRLWQAGRDAAEIAERLGVPCPTVYRLLQRFRRDGASGVAPGYRRSSETFPSSDGVKDAIDLRREHPTWGAEFIRVQLLEIDPAKEIPSARALRRWFARADLSPAKAGRRPKVKADRAVMPHAVWQMDAKEHIKLKNKKEVSWLRLIDECSGAVLHTTVFPPRVLA